eukprot:380527-Rhodomonas_salina.1
MEASCCYSFWRRRSGFCPQPVHTTRTEQLLPRRLAIPTLKLNIPLDCASTRVWVIHWYHAHSPSLDACNPQRQNQRSLRSSWALIRARNQFTPAAQVSAKVGCRSTAQVDHPAFAPVSVCACVSESESEPVSVSVRQSVSVCRWRARRGQRSPHSASLSTASLVLPPC